MGTTSRNAKIIDLIRDQAEKYQDKVYTVGMLRLTTSLLSQLTSGYIRNSIQQIPNYYSQFRNKIFRDENQNFFEKTLIAMIKEKKYISVIELDIIIFIMLGNIRNYFNRNLRLLTENTNNDILENVKSIYKNVVNVDEATDFSVITLGCMYYLCNPHIKSFTLTGDLMQRITLFGITEWNNLDYLRIQTELKYLHKVYRQSYKLLEMAKCLYTQFVGKPEFDSAFEPDENEPSPLIYQTTENEIFKEWITKRILEIDSITQHKASIALFVADDSAIDPLGDLLDESLADNTLYIERCKDGKILSNESKIRIFSVEHIKGLEFEAVFYINIDDIFVKYPELIDKFLYVGLTRAGSFLGITYKKEFPPPLECIRDLLSEGDWHWLIE